jgi:hypothetical protein
MVEFAEKFEFVKKHYHCKLCPGQFGRFQENKVESAKKTNKLHSFIGQDCLNIAE